VTANAILKGKLQDKSTYSVYFGQTFDAALESSAKITFGRGVYNVETVSDLRSVPDSFDRDALVNCMNRHFTDSSVRVYRIINLVYIFRKLSSRRRHKAGDGTDETLLQQQKQEKKQ